MKFSMLLLSVAMLGLPLGASADTKPAAKAPVAAAPVATVPAKQTVAGATGARVNVNTADVVALTALKGVGPKKAQAIVEYRKSHGAFSSLEQFEDVPGIGPVIISNNRTNIVFR